MTSQPTAKERARRSLAPFAEAVKPLFFGRAITYVDVGAYTGEVFDLFGELGPRILDAHLIEANPETFATLEAKYHADRRAITHHTALGDREHTVTIELRGTMSRVVDEQGARTAATVPMTTLDALMADQGVEHIHVLKVDVEGSELKVLAGASRLLAENAVDVIYIEAGMSGQSTQQAHHRDIEAVLEPYGYRMMGVYEQKHEWIDDLPTLRRANIGFISQTFAESHPFQLSRELVRAREEVDSLAERVDKLERERDKLRQSADRYRNRAERTAEALTVAKAARLAAAMDSPDLAPLTAERDALLAWGIELDRRLRRVLGSRWWRLTRIPRAVVTRTRARLGKSRVAPVAPLPRPKATTAPVRGSAELAGEILRAARGPRIGALHQLIRRLELGAGEAQGWILLQFALICFDYNATAFANVARTADGIIGRRGSLDPGLATMLGNAPYRLLLTNVTKSLGRLGQVDKAVAMLAPAIAAGHRELRAVRAELIFPTDREGAIADLRAFLAEATPTHPLRSRCEFMLAHLCLDGSEAALSVQLIGDPTEIRLARAIDSTLRGDPKGYAEHLNAFFTGNGLVPVIAGDADAIRGDAWSSPAASPSPHDLLVTVIVTAFNAEATIARSLDSLRAQSHSRLEIIVVEDHSTDATLDIVKAIAAQDQRVTVMRTPMNSGTYAAKNLAVVAATGEFVTFHDADDWAHPQRIERHLDVMAGNASLVATRSDWLRINGEGDIDVRRWGMRAPHPNPASAFIRREAFAKIGVFDPVKFGADSEFWYRLNRMLPPKSTMSIKLPLGIGLHHPASLTRAGAGAWNADHYSAVRSAYQLSWSEAHATRGAEALAYHLGQPRHFWAPAATLREADTTPMPATRATAYPIDSDVEPFVFAISMTSKAAATNWDRAQELLDRTLRSLVGQSDPRWTAIVCGHERPQLSVLDDPRIVFISSPKPAPTKRSGFRTDKNYKRRIIASHARALGGGYFFPLDADDLVHRDVVAHARADDNRRGYVATTGYAEDFVAGRLAPIPGAWTLSFDRVCGSAIVLYFEVEDLPRDPEQTEPTYFDLFSHHAYWAGTAEEYRGPLDAIPFPAGVYSLNTGQNLSFQLQRANRRGTNILESIERHALAERFTILRDEFGQR